MNLQITVPYQTCPFKCPFCIANNPKVQSIFSDVYTLNKNQYFKNLLKAVFDNDITTIVITGDTEPTLNMLWFNEVASFIKAIAPQVKIELQTKNFNLNTLREVALSPIDVIALSIDKNSQLEKLSEIHLNGKLKRATVVLNSEFEPSQANFYGFDQVTFKEIQKGENEEINKWIDEHRFNKLDKLAELVSKYPNASFFYDKNCMVAENRYLIFRSDGMIYTNWTSVTPR
jgi:adenine C2-methylase RlmN of 23S rRNA A2503 and tRNA A37